MTDDVDHIEMFRESVRAFCEKEVNRELQRQMDVDDVLPRGLRMRMAELGFTGLAVPEEYGGSGGSIYELVVLAEELSRCSSAISGSIMTTAVSGSTNILLSGSEEQRRDLLPKIAGGTCSISMAITEPNSGSDAAALRTRAIRVEGGWRLSGNKMFITGANEADLIMVLARTEKSERRQEGLTIFLVPRPSVGLIIAKLDKIGNRGCSSCDVALDEVLIPEDAVLGGIEAVGRGWSQLMRTFEVERILMGAMALGTARRALDDAVVYAQQREQFGQPIGNFQAIGHMLADMATSVAASRAFLWDVAGKFAAGKPCSEEAAMVKLFTTEQAKQVCLSGMQVLGGYGYLGEFDMERCLRDSLLGPIGGGTSQIQRTIIARGLGFKT